jgi:hypothetical protein
MYNIPVLLDNFATISTVCVYVETRAQGGFGGFVAKIFVYRMSKFDSLVFKSKQIMYVDICFVHNKRRLLGNVVRDLL